MLLFILANVILLIQKALTKLRKLSKKSCHFCSKDIFYVLDPPLAEEVHAKETQAVHSFILTILKMLMFRLLQYKVRYFEFLVFLSLCFFISLSFFLSLFLCLSVSLSLCLSASLSKDAYVQIATVQGERLEFFVFLSLCFFVSL
jgi:hypothetical protein